MFLFLYDLNKKPVHFSNRAKFIGGVGLLVSISEICIFTSLHARIALFYRWRAKPTITIGRSIVALLHKLKRQQTAAATTNGNRHSRGEKRRINAQLKIIIKYITEKKNKRFGDDSAR